MSRTRFYCACLAALIGQAMLVAMTESARSLVHANQPPGPGRNNQPRNRRPGPPNPAAPKRDVKPADPNLLSMDLKALRIVRALEATPHQISEIARAAKTTAGSPGKRDAAKVSEQYIEAMVQMRRALIANDGDKIDQLRTQFDELEQKGQPDLDDEVEITDGAEIEAVRLLKLFGPQQVVAYAESLGEDFPDPVQLIADGLEEGRSLKGEEWETARNKISEEVGWLIWGSQGEKATKLEGQVSAFLDQKHAEGAAPAREPEIRKLIDSPGPIIVLNNIMEHALAELLSNPQVERAARECLGQGSHPAPPQKPASVAVNQSAAPPPPPKNESRRPRRQEPQSGEAVTKNVDLDEVMKSPEAYQGQQVQFQHVTVIGTSPGKVPANLWLAIKTGSGNVLNASRDQKLTILIPVARTPQTIKDIKPGDGISVTIVCSVKRDGPKHWSARVLSLHEEK